MVCSGFRTSIRSGRPLEERVAEIYAWANRAAQIFARSADGVERRCRAEVDTISGAGGGTAMRHAAIRSQFDRRRPPPGSRESASGLRASSIVNAVSLKQRSAISLIAPSAAIPPSPMMSLMDVFVIPLWANRSSTSNPTRPPSARATWPAASSRRAACRRIRRGRCWCCRRQWLTAA